MIFSLIVETSSGVNSTNAIKKYLLVVTGDPTLFVLVVWNGKYIRSRRVEVEMFYSSLKHCKSVGLFVQM